MTSAVSKYQSLSVKASMFLVCRWQLVAIIAIAKIAVNLIFAIVLRVI